VYSREVTRSLREKEVEVIFVHHDAESPADGSVRLRSLPLSRLWAIAPPGTGRRLAEVLRRRQVDLVHVSLSFSSLDFSLPDLCRELGVPLVATLHAPFDNRRTRWGGLSQMLYRIYAVPLARFDRVIVFGSAQRRLLTRMGVPESAVCVIPNGVDVERFQPGPSPLPEELNASRIFLYMGRLDPEKNVDLLVESFLASTPPPELRLVIAGTGRERRRLERRYRSRQVIFLGLVGDEQRRIGLLRGAEAFFLPSAIEGLSLALLEAMACGVCPVATDVGCDGEVIRGVGITLDPTSLGSDLRLAMRLLTSTPGLARELGARARSRVTEGYTLAGGIAQLLDVYQRVLKDCHPGWR
jgi:glycosyltransferase involved in cell wall biosynthesis